MDAGPARQRWELENDVQGIENPDSYWKYDNAEQQAIQNQKPWAKDPHHFKRYLAPSIPSRRQQAH